MKLSVSDLSTLSEEDKLDIDQAATLLGVSPRTIRRRVDAGELKPLPESLPAGAKKSPKFLFSRFDVQKLIVNPET